MSFLPHPSDHAWRDRFRRLLRLLDDATAPGEQLAVIQRDDIDRAGTCDIYVACPRRGLHERLVDCWACWSDVASGKVRASEVLRIWSNR